MPKDVSEYTPEELQEMGRKVVLRRQKDSERNAEKRTLVKQLLAAHKAGKIKL